MKSTPLSNKKKSVSTKEIPTQSLKGEKGEPKQKPDNLKVQSQIPPLPEDGIVVNPFPVVAIGASAGGLEAITQLLQNLSPNTGMAYIYVQHLSPDHKSLLTPLLSKITEMKVQDIEDMEKIKPDNVYVIPYNKEIEVVDGHIQLIPRPKNKTSNLSIDVLFSSLAETHKENVIGIVLSGSASDGTRGLKEIKQAGGITFAQDDSAKFPSMPQSAIAAGVVDFVLSPKEIANELTWMSKHPFVKRNAIKTAPEDEIENSNPDLKIILQILYKRKNVDFSHYKMNTIKRRILRRMLIHKIKTLKLYAGLLGQKNNEVDLLYQDLLINVTDFFRDTDAFLILKKNVLPRLLKSKAPGETLRIWVPACATGEEVYSIIMMLLEIQINKANKIPFQIFASDLSAEAIIEARIGEYSVQRLKNVSPKRLQHFFTKTKDKYRITKSLRDVCVFAQHNILHDPPFSHIDFISCRNMLIYLDTAAQKKAIATFHYALNEGGCLLLGKSETIGTSSQLFTALNKKYKIYSRKKKSGIHTIPVITPRFSQLSTGQTVPTLPEKNITITSIPQKLTAASNGNLGSAFDSVLLSR
ncbi:MAG TPA: chemotaxis protein CheB, partial [Ferruginibacter sp.]|nr:chemotaxis protein CheB [Ferruginibacter sp.]